MAPIAVILGKNANVGIGEETTEGTAVSATRFARLVSLSIDDTVTRVRIPDLSVGSTGFTQARFVEQKSCNVTMEVIPYYENGNLAMFMRMCLGGAWATTGAGPYTHTLEVGTLDSWTIRTERDVLSSTGAFQEGDVIAGFRVNEWSFSQDTNGVARLRISGEAVSRTAGSAPGHTLPTHDDPILSHAADAWTWNSADACPRSIEISGSNGLLALRCFASSSISNQVVNDVRDIRVSVTRYKPDDSWLDAHIAGTSSDGDITWTDGADTFTARAYNAIILDPVNVSNNTIGVVEETGVFVPRDDGTDPVFEVVLVNGDATAEAS